MVHLSGFFPLLAALFLASPTSAAPSLFGGLHPLERRDISWQNCSIFGVDSQDPHFSCAVYDVPMDYHDSNAGQANLAVIKFCGDPTKKIGTLFLNPGGPGKSGVDFITQTGPELSAMLGGAYDLISWDPRGVGPFTFPGYVTCFNTSAEDSAYFKNTIVQSINYTIAGGFNQQDQDELFARANQDSDLLITFGEKCQQGPVGNFLQYIGTTSTVRDLVTLADCIVGSGGPIDFWGFDYGTVIGSTLLTMFPERAGHIILDGVIDPKTWANFNAPNTALADADKTFSTFGDACAASGTAGCKLVEFIPDGTTNNVTGPEITKLLNDAHDTSLALQRAGFTGLSMAPGELLGAIYQALTVPATWSDFANTEAFIQVLSIFQAAKSLGIPFGNYIIPTGQVRARAPPQIRAVPVVTSHTSYAVPSADDTQYTLSGRSVLDIGTVLSAIVNNVKTVSPSFGANWNLGYHYGWPVRTVEPIPAPNFGGVSKPVLLVGNSADPLTPFAGAQSTANQIGNLATLVEQQGVGHTSMSQSSSCTTGIISGFLLSSTLPSSANGPVQCAVDPSSNNLFPGAGSKAAKRNLDTIFRRRVFAPY